MDLDFELLAKRVLLEMAEELLAFLQPEAEARAVDEPWHSSPQRIDQHILRPTLRRLFYDGQLGRSKDTTRGGREIIIYHPTNLSRRRRAFEDVAGRKRLLYSRYLGWAHGTELEFRGGLIGPAAELMLHHCLRAASPTVGYKLENPQGGRTETILDHGVPTGPLDNAAHVHIGNPSQRYIVLFEVKSYRNWVYHETHEQLFQVLYKAAVLQKMLPAERIVPVLVCRRAHFTAFHLMKDLGGHIIATRRQWVLPRARVTEETVNEVSTELNFDLHLTPRDFMFKHLLKQLITTLPGQIPSQAERWQSAGCLFDQEYFALWQGKYLHPLGAIREAMDDEGLYGGFW